MVGILWVISGLKNTEIKTALASNDIWLSRLLLSGDLSDEAQDNIRIENGMFITVIDNPEVPRLEVKLNLPKKGVGDGWCVSYAKYVTGLEYFGDAREWKAYVNSQEAKVGAVVVLKESNPLGHLAVVVEVRENSILITEQNYEGRYLISQREVDLKSPTIVGYIIR